MQAGIGCVNMANEGSPHQLWEDSSCSSQWGMTGNQMISPFHPPGMSQNSLQCGNASQPPGFSCRRPGKSYLGEICSCGLESSLIIEFWVSPLLPRRRVHGGTRAVLPNRHDQREWTVWCVQELNSLVQTLEFLVEQPELSCTSVDLNLPCVLPL